MSKTFVVCAVATNLIAALLAAWPVNLFSAMVAGIVVGLALGAGFGTKPVPLAGRTQPAPPGRGLYRARSWSEVRRLYSARALTAR
jgi:hypothetical protein